MRAPSSRHRLGTGDGLVSKASRIPPCPHRVCSLVGKINMFEDLHVNVKLSCDKYYNGRMQSWVSQNGHLTYAGRSRKSSLRRWYKEQIWRQRRVCYRKNLLRALHPGRKECGDFEELREGQWLEHRRRGCGL